MTTELLQENIVLCFKLARDEQPAARLRLLTKWHELAKMRQDFYTVLRRS